MLNRCEQLVRESFENMRQAMEEARQLAVACRSYQAAKKLAKAASYAGQAAGAALVCGTDGGFERGIIYRGLAADVLKQLKRCLGEEATLSGFRSRAKRRRR
jgi:hypothetical protein